MRVLEPDGRGLAPRIPVPGGTPPDRRGRRLAARIPRRTISACGGAAHHEKETSWSSRRFPLVGSRPSRCHSSSRRGRLRAQRLFDAGEPFSLETHRPQCPHRRRLRRRRPSGPRRGPWLRRAEDAPRANARLLSPARIPTPGIRRRRATTSPATGSRTCSFGPLALRLHVNLGGGAFAPAASRRFAFVRLPLATAADFNGDGVADAVLTERLLDPRSPGIGRRSLRKGPSLGSAPTAPRRGGPRRRRGHRPR